MARDRWRIDRAWDSSGAADRSAGRLTPVTSLERAIVEALAYSDVFDWPLTPSEVHAYLPIAAAPEEVDAALEPTDRPGSAPSGLGRLVVVRDGLAVLAGREELIERRRRRIATSAELWRRAGGLAASLAWLPFVRMVALTGSLAMGAAEGDADVDLFVVTADGRLWLTRAMTIGVVRVAAARRVRLCPNYFVAESALELSQRDTFTAHELAQMVPIAGLDTYHELLERNDWYRSFLPNHRVGERPDGSTWPRRRRIQRVVEPAMRSAALDPLERWEMRRKVARLSARATSSEQRFDAAVCKGHFEEHGQVVLAAFHQRLAALGRATV